MLEVTATRTTITALPSFGMLTNFNEPWDSRTDERTADAVAYINSTLGNSSYFDSDRDRYSSSFRRTIDRHFRDVARTNRDIRIARGALTQRDEFRPCVTPDTLSNLPPCMYKSVLAEPTLYTLFKQKRVQGFGDLTEEDMDGEVERWRRLIDVNGHATLRPRKTPTNRLTVFSFRFESDDPFLTPEQMDAVADTRAYVAWILKNTESDPTDLTQLRG